MHNIQNLGDNYSALKSALEKKKSLLRNSLIAITLYLVSRIGVNIGRVYLDSIYMNFIEETFQLLFIYTLLFLYRARTPNVVHIRVLPDGQIGVVALPAPNPSASGPIEMV